MAAALNDLVREMEEAGLDEADFGVPQRFGDNTVGDINAAILMALRNVKLLKAQKVSRWRVRL